MMIYRFNDFELDLAQRRLTRNGVTVPTEPKVFDVLLFLVENRHRFVAREELLERCWSGLFVSDGTLSRCLSRVRAALGQARGASSPILTLHCKGYRFIPEIETVGDTQAAAGSATQPTERRPQVARVVERRFISIVRGGFAASDGAVEECDRSLRFLAEVVKIAKHYHCKAVLIPGTEFNIQAGHPKPLEHPTKVAVAVAKAISRSAKTWGLCARMTVSSGIAVVDRTAEEAGEAPILLGVEPIYVVGPIRPGAPQLFIDHRTVETLGVEADVASAKGRLANGGETTLYYFRSECLADANPGPEPLFVGREPELLDLLRRWEKTCNGTGQVIRITGEPGIGKSALIEEFVRRRNMPGNALLAMRCSPYHIKTEFYPLLALLRQKLGINVDTPPIQMLRMIERFLERIDRPPTDHLPLLASMLSAAFPSRSLPELRLCRERLRERTMEAMLYMIISAAQHEPILLWVDDAHWADRATMTVLERLMEIAPQNRLMIVVCSRDEADDKSPFAAVKTIVLGQMDKTHRIRLLSDLSERGFLPSKLIPTISERSEGVPLYLREIVRMVHTRKEKGEPYLDLQGVPDSLHGLLASRLETSGSALPVAQWAAVVGRSFSTRLLGLVTGLSCEKLDQHIRWLVAVGIFSPGRGCMAEEYCFTHVLVRDAAYETMLVTTRRKRHLKIAQTLWEHFPATVAAEPERIAVHFSYSNEPHRAAEFWEAVTANSVQKYGMADSETFSGGSELA